MSGLGRVMLGPIHMDQGEDWREFSFAVVFGSDGYCQMDNICTLNPGTARMLRLLMMGAAEATGIELEEFDSDLALAARACHIWPDDAEQFRRVLMETEGSA